jgi:hypothetical protein
LIAYFTPPGRGSIVSHTLYLDREMEKVRREAGAAAVSGESGGWRRAESQSGDHAPVPSRPRDEPVDTGSAADEISSQRGELANLRRELEAARNEFTMVTEELRRDLDQLNQQLGN